MSLTKLSLAGDGKIASFFYSVALNWGQPLLEQQLRYAFPSFYHFTIHASSKLPSHYISCLTRPFPPAQMGKTPIRTSTLALGLCGAAYVPPRWPVWGGKQRGGHCSVQCTYAAHTDLFLFLWRGLTGTTTRNPRIQTWKLDLWSTYNWNIFGHVLSKYYMLGFYRSGSASSMIMERPPNDTHTTSQGEQAIGWSVIRLPHKF